MGAPMLTSDLSREELLHLLTGHQGNLALMYHSPRFRAGLADYHQIASFWARQCNLLQQLARHLPATIHVEE